MSFYNTTPLPVTVFTTPTGTGVNPLCILKNESPSQTLFVGLCGVYPEYGGAGAAERGTAAADRDEERLRVLELVGGHRGGYGGDGCVDGRHHVVDGGVGRDGEHPGRDVLRDRREDGRRRS